MTLIAYKTYSQVKISGENILSVYPYFMQYCPESDADKLRKLGFTVVTQEEYDAYLSSVQEEYDMMQQKNKQKLYVEGFVEFTTSAKYPKFLKIPEFAITVKEEGKYKCTYNASATHLVKNTIYRFALLLNGVLIEASIREIKTAMSSDKLSHNLDVQINCGFEDIVEIGLSCDSGSISVFQRSLSLVRVGDIQMSIYEEENQ
jgi:hypothetical protein